jgi:hypothetical protein
MRAERQRRLEHDRSVGATAAIDGGRREFHARQL